ncbi:MAG: hypothetical protein KA313_07355 [Pseudarcicella sp.]|nr:hypothetical protein [Pseudarcicella sp.]
MSAQPHEYLPNLRVCPTSRIFTQPTCLPNLTNIYPIYVSAQSHEYLPNLRVCPISRIFIQPTYLPNFLPTSNVKA